MSFIFKLDNLKNKWEKKTTRESRVMRIKQSTELATHNLNTVSLIWGSSLKASMQFNTS